MWTLLLVIALTQQDKQLVFGDANVIIGNNAAAKLESGNFDYCVGEGACPNVVDQSCVVDIRQLDAKAKKQLKSLTPLSVGPLLSTIKKQNAHCGYDKRRKLPRR
jgi:hypothetical protein